MANIFGRQVVVALTNKSGGSVIAGDVVIVDTGNDGAFTTTTSAAFTGAVGVAQETIANNATGRVLLAGYAALVNTTASVTRGNFATTSTTVKKAVDAGSSRVVGTFCQFLTGGTTPTAHVFGMADASSATGNVATDAIWDAKGDLAAGTGANTAAKLTVGANDTILMADSGETTGLKWVASATPSTQAFGDAAAAGTADTFTRGDHKHAMPANPVASGTLVEVDYVEFTSNVTITATTEATANTVVTANALAGDGSTKYIIELHGGIVLPSGASFWATLYDGSGSIGHWQYDTNVQGPNPIIRRLTPSNASHTYSFRAYVGGGTGTVQAGAGGNGNFLPGYIRIVKITS
jgi:hypothetical protein